MIDLGAIRARHEASRWHGTSTDGLRAHEDRAALLVELGRVENERNRLHDAARVAVMTLDAIRVAPVEPFPWGAFNNAEGVLRHALELVAEQTP